MRVLAFDVNETLLDLAALDAPFRELFGTPDVRREWFQQLLRSAPVEEVMRPGPSTFRANVPADQMLDFMQQKEIRTAP